MVVLGRREEEAEEEEPRRCECGCRGPGGHAGRECDGRVPLHAAAAAAAARLRTTARYVLTRTRGPIASNFAKGLRVFTNFPESRFGLHKLQTFAVFRKV